MEDRATSSVRGGLVGRQLEVGAIRRLLEALRAAKRPRGAGFVEIVGEPGIGKSRLLGESALLAAGQGQVVVSGRATEFERGVPFGLVVEALDDHLATLDPPDQQRLCGEWLGLLAEVFPALQAWRHRFGVQLREAERYRLHRAVRALLEALAEPPGLVMLLDDLHWADPASIELLVHLLRHPPRGPVLVAVSYRVHRAPAALAVALADAARGESVQRLELGPLTVAATAELLGRPVGQCWLLHERSGGNPFYLQLLACADPDTLNTADHQGIGDLDAAVPANLRCALQAELDALSPTQRLVVQAAAVAGDPCEPELVALTAGTDAAETLQALDELVTRDLLRTADARRRFRFRHPLVRHLIYNSAGAGWCAGAHARLAGELAARNAPLVTRAQHVARAARTGDENAISLLLAAAEATLPRSPATAAEWLSTALTLLPAQEQAALPRRLDLLLRLADALRLSGLLEASRDALADALPLVPAESKGLRARVTTSQAGLERLLGRYPQARALLRGELDSLSQLGSSEAAELLFELAGSARVHGDFSEAHRWAERAVAAARDHDPPVYAAALALLAGTTASRGDARYATTLLAKASELLDTLPDSALTPRLESTVWVGWAALFFDRYDDASRHFARGLVLARRARQDHVSTRLLVGQAGVRGILGPLSEATEVAVAAADAAEISGSPELLATALAMRCWFAGWAGDVDTARWAGQQAVQAARTVTGTALVLAEGMLAHARLLDGDPARCVSDLLRAGGGAELPNVYPLSRATWYEILVRAELAQEQRIRALGWADRAEAAAATVGVPGQAGIAQLGHAEVLLDGDGAACVERAGAAATVFTELGDRLQAGRARLLAGQALTEVGKHDDAVRELEAARMLFAEMEVPRLGAETVRRLRRLGRRVASPRAAGDGTVGPGGLTSRERDVAGLVAQGYSNRQIAEDLVLSVRTVTTHISHIFAKLGVSSRTGIAAVWANSRRTS